MKVLQYRHSDGRRLGVLDDDDTVVDLSAPLRLRGVAPTFTGAMQAAADTDVALPHLVATLRDEADAERLQWNPSDATVRGAERYPVDVPVDAPEAWAAGVTYLRSRAARMEESGEEHRDFYDRVYEAERPEIFMKDADGRRTVACGEAVGVRGDSTWTVPEPELALIVDRRGSIVAYTVGDDVTARDVEAQNPLYLPQAKVFVGALSLGPVALLADNPDGEPDFSITLRISDTDGVVTYEEAIGTSSMKRSLHELTRWLLRYNTVADGTVLLTGTGLVPPDDHALKDGQRVEVDIDGIGALWNSVRLLT